VRFHYNRNGFTKGFRIRSRRQLQYYTVGPPYHTHTILDSLSHLILGNLEVLWQLELVEGGGKPAVLDNNAQARLDVLGEGGVQGRSQAHAYRVVIRHLVGGMSTNKTIMLLQIIFILLLNI
jgi:hypothetical protein